MLIKSIIIFAGVLQAVTSETCAENTCYGRGDCYPQQADQIVCVCRDEFTGDRCQYDKVDCSRKGCHGRGTCVNDHCVCHQDYAGPFCDYTNHCRENPCRDHGKCISQMDGFQCLCDKGYTTHNCEEDINECTQNPDICQNGGTCLNQEGSFICKCPSGYDGQLCGFTVNMCDPNPCQNGGNCFNDKSISSGFRCECPRLFSGELCEVEATDCGCVHGTCSEDQGGACSCDLGWMGYRCSEKITTCHWEWNPCQNGTGPNQISTCKEYIVNGNRRNIHCQCGIGLTGKFCEESIDMCSQNPCRGNGNCTDLGGGEYKCDCFPGYTEKNCELDINECNDDPCKNGGECFNTDGEFYCECKPGFGGNFCEKNIDDCAQEPCKNGGTCTDGDNSYTCTCQPGFTGKNCETEINECESNSCPSYSICVDKINHYRCICNSADEIRGNCEIDENECTANLCKNGGQCIDLPGDFRCECPNGYSGDTCQFDETACGVKPCGAHGTCYLRDGNLHEHYCVCIKGYQGADCSIDHNECQPDPCKNGATCIDQLGDYFCECPAIYTGKDCDLDARRCAHNPCQNGGTCAPAAQHPYYQCTCESGYMGTRCQEEILCEPSKCGNKGKCVMLDESTDLYRCECNAGYTGTVCQTELVQCGKDFCHNDGTCNAVQHRCECKSGWKGDFCKERLTCLDRPCGEGGTCIPGRFGFQCKCRDGYTGSRCETQSTMVCSPNPCKNGGTCSPIGASFTCTCPPGYAGLHCDKQDFCLPNPCKAGHVCENFPKPNPMKYICCEETSWMCYNDDGCPNECTALKNDSICQNECYNTECQADVADCSQNLENNEDVWGDCPESKCRGLFNNGVCNAECTSAECNYDGMDCVSTKDTCEYEKYCKTYINNGLCDQGCNSTACRWDGQDCLYAGTHHKAKERIKVTVDVTCERVKEFKSQLTITLDDWSRAITIIESIVPVVDEENRCDLYLSFDNRYCGSDCRTGNAKTLKSYLWACLQSNQGNHSTSPFPFHVMAITSAESEPNTLHREQVSTAIICTIAVIGLLLLIAAVMVGRNVYRARARLWEPDGFKTSRKRNIKDISKMGDPVHLKTMPKLSDQHNFNYYMSENMSQVMDVDLEPMYVMSSRSHGRSVYDDQDETAPMITQAAYELRQRDETASPVTQAEEQIAIGRPSGRMCLGRGETQLHVVCRNKKTEELKRILAQGNVDVNVTDAYGRTPLYAAVGSYAVEIVDILLEVEGIDLEKAIVQKLDTPLILAAKMVYNSIVEKLLKAKAHVNQADSSGRTALHWAAAVSNIHAMELLLAHGANKDAESTRKETPLFLAAREGKLEAVKVLVVHNAQRHLADSMDQTPIDVARDHLHTDIEQVLLTWNTDGNTVLKQQQQHVQLPGSLTPPQSDDAATGSPNSIPTLSPCEKEASDREDKKNSKRKKKKMEHNPQSHPAAYNQTGYWAKNQVHSPPNWVSSTQMLSPESLTGSPTSTSLPTTCDPNIPSSESHQRLTHYPLHAGYPIDTPQSYIPHDHLLSQHRPNNNRQFPHHPSHQLDYHSSPDSPEETWQITSPPNSDWSHTSP